MIGQWPKSKRKIAFHILNLVMGLIFVPLIWYIQDANETIAWGLVGLHILLTLLTHYIFLKPRCKAYCGRFANKKNKTTGYCDTCLDILQEELARTNYE